MVNFFASWCVPCRSEHAELARAASNLQDSGVKFIGVVYQDRPDAARQFLSELGTSYDVVTDPGSRAAIDFGMFGVPETFFVDATGSVAGKVAELWRLNEDRIGTGDPNLIYAGTELRLR